MNIRQEIENFLTMKDMDKRGQAMNGIIFLLAFLMVGIIGGIFVLQMEASVQQSLPTTLSTNANLVAVQQTYIPLTIAAVAVGAGITALVLGITLVGGRGR